MIPEETLIRNDKPDSVPVLELARQRLILFEPHRRAWYTSPRLPPYTRYLRLFLANTLELIFWAVALPI